jgi:hypothetical protein
MVRKLKMKLKTYPCAFEDFIKPVLCVFLLRHNSDLPGLPKLLFGISGDYVDFVSVYPTIFFQCKVKSEDNLLCVHSTGSRLYLFVHPPQGGEVFLPCNFRSHFARIRRVRENFDHFSP